MREIILDTETTGLDPTKGDRLIEIGCVEFVNMIPTGATFHKYLNPERTVSKGAFDVHGISDEFLADKPRFAAIADAFTEFLGDARIVIHNASFDVGFLNMELARVGKPALASERVVDTLALARRKHPGSPASLDALCARYGIDNSNRTKHGALLDAEILAEVYCELTGGRQSRFNLDTGPARRARGEDTPDQAAPRRPATLGSKLTAEESQAHERFVATLGANALWLRYLAQK